MDDCMDGWMDGNYECGYKTIYGAGKTICYAYYICIYIIYCMYVTMFMYIGIYMFVFCVYLYPTYIFCLLHKSRPMPKATLRTGFNALTCSCTSTTAVVGWASFILYIT